MISVAPFHRRVPEGDVMRADLDPYWPARRLAAAPISVSTWMPPLTLGRVDATTPDTDCAVPPRSRRADCWQVSVGRDWVPVEAPLEPREHQEAANSWSRVGHGFAVNVYAAVVTSAFGTGGVSSCRVLKPDRILTSLAALPDGDLLA